MAFRDSFTYASKVEKYYKIAIEAGLDILVIQGTVVSAEHVRKVIPLDLKQFISSCPIPVIVGGVASIQLHSI